MMIYNISDRPPFGKNLLFSLQLVLACFVATCLIAQICGVSWCFCCSCSRGSNTWWLYWRGNWWSYFLYCLLYFWFYFF